MTLLTRDRTERNQPPTPTSGSVPLRSPVALGVLGAAQAAAGSLLCVLAPAVIIWMGSTTTGAVWTEAARVGAAAWLLAHHATIIVPGASMSLAPLGLTLLVALSCWSAGRRLAYALPTAPSGRRQHRLAAWLAFVCAYALLALGLTLMTGTSVARAVSAQAMLGAAVVAGLGGGAGILRPTETERRPRIWRRSRTTVPTGPITAATMGADALRLPRAARRVAGAAAVSVAAWLAAAAALTAVAMFLGWDRIVGLHEALGPGPVGSGGLALTQLAYLPTAVVWAASWLAGPGFAVGAGSAVTPAVVTLGPLPAFPLLGALPEPGTTPGWFVGAVAVPVLAGALGGWHLHRAARAVPRLQLLALAPAVGLVAGAAGLMLAWSASGAVGPGRMAVMGPSPVAVGLTLAGEVAAGCLIAVLLLPGGGRLGGATAPAAVRWLASAAAGQLSRLPNRLRSSIRRS